MDEKEMMAHAKAFGDMLVAKADELTAMAAQVRDEVYAREAIAQGFELIANVMRMHIDMPLKNSCEDCQQQIGEVKQQLEEVGFVMPMQNTETSGAGNTPGADETLKIPGA